MELHQSLNSDDTECKTVEAHKHLHAKRNLNLDNAGRKTVLVGVTGGVAAYKSCELVRALQKRNVRVKVIMTENATHFVDPTQFRALTREPVALDMFNAADDPVYHISLAQEADAFIIAPCTANVIAKLANGIADDLLTTTALACTAPLIIAPAMNEAMYNHPATQANLATLIARNVSIVDGAFGYLACGDEGKGRLAHTSTLVLATMTALKVKQDLAGLTVLITAGPTIEPIDPVRYISNPSSGKTGFAYAVRAQARGANVILISGPVALKPLEGIEYVSVSTTSEMFDAVDERFERCDIGIFSAAVTDFRPRFSSPSKLKRSMHASKLQTIELVENVDILKTMANRKQNRIVVGYAAETEDVEDNARDKLQAKGADLIVGNLAGKGHGFGTDDNEVIVVSADTTLHLGPASKSVLADEVLSLALTLRKSDGFDTGLKEI